MTSQQQVPPVPYFGGKQRLAPQIVDLFPHHDTYIEPFAGSLSVLLAKPQSKHETVNDIDQRLVTFWRVLRDRPADLERVCTLTPHSRAEYVDCWDHLDGTDPAADELETARRVFTVLNQGRSRAMREAGWKNAVTGASPPMASRLATRVAAIAPVAARLADVQIECRDALELIDNYGKPGNLLYVDPPYLDETRASAAYYGHELATADDHRQLLELLRDTPANVALSGYDSELYAEMLPDWERVKLSAYVIGVPRVEVVWMNYQQQPALFGGVE